MGFFSATLGGDAVFLDMRSRKRYHDKQKNGSQSGSLPQGKNQQSADGGKQNRRDPDGGEHQ
jgi:ribosome assembly protein YihI (activator of Der GTPase)